MEKDGQSPYTQHCPSSIECVLNVHPGFVTSIQECSPDTCLGKTWKDAITKAVPTIPTVCLVYSVQCTVCSILQLSTVHKSGNNNSDRYRPHATTKNKTANKNVHQFHFDFNHHHHHHILTQHTVCPLWLICSWECFSDTLLSLHTLN